MSLAAPETQASPRSVTPFEQLDLSKSAAIPVLFAGTLFLSAALLFAVQPMIAKMLLPRLGGAAAVWNTCLVFFQSALLAGYLYAHLTTRWLAPKQQAILHLILLTAALAFLPIRIPEDWEAPLEWPIGAVLSLLVATVGVPFVVVSGSAPLLQRWLAVSRHTQSANPYWLYAASNAGSLLALLAYPFVVEPNLDTSAQVVVWASVYGGLIALMIICTIVIWRVNACAAAPEPATTDVSDAAPDNWARVRWVVLAFVPSSLLAGVTHYMTCDVAAIPLLWVVPLALYLLTFILAFAPLSVGLHRLALYLMPAALIVQALTMWSGSSRLGFVLPIHMIAFAITALVYHSELSRRRPAAGSLTEYYLWIAVGGVLGSLFNGLLAPMVFVQLEEFPLVLVAALLCMPLAAQTPRGTLVGRGVLAGLALVLVLIFWNIRAQADAGLIIHRERSYFSVLRVQRGNRNETHWLYHGRINHGGQFTGSDIRKRRFPLGYFDPTGPIGQAFAASSEEHKRQPIGIVGLGIGTLSTYVEPGQDLTYYEIDPAVVAIARDPKFFTFLKDSEVRGVRLRVVIGDARRSLEREPDGCFGTLILDAFSGDSIPAHLITQEAIDLSMKKVGDKGWLIVQISNQYFDFEPVIAKQAEVANLVGIVQHDRDMTEAEYRRGKMSSSWAILARSEADLGQLRHDPRWKRLRATPQSPHWTDRYSNLLGVMRTN